MWVDTFFLVGKNGGIQGFDPSWKGMLWSINNHLLTKSSSRQCLYAEVWNTELPDVIGSAHMISTLKISALGTKPTKGLDASLLFSCCWKCGPRFKPNRYIETHLLSNIKWKSPERNLGSPESVDLERKKEMWCFRDQEVCQTLKRASSKVHDTCWELELIYSGVLSVSPFNTVLAECVEFGSSFVCVCVWGSMCVMCVCSVSMFGVCVVV